MPGGARSGDTWINSITKFVDAARAWSTANRGGSFPADVINVHYYSFGPGAPAPALSPEDDDVESKLAAVVSYRDKYLPGKPVWWSPTSTANLHPGYSLALPGGATTVTAVALVDKQQNGTATPLTATGGAVTLDVTETPTIVLYGP